MSSKENVEMKASQLMTRIKKQLEYTKGIENFGNLLHEICCKDSKYVETIVKEMHQFMDDFNRIADDVDNLTDKALISRILSYDFIVPKKYFPQSRKNAATYIKLNRCLVNKFNSMHLSNWEIGKDNILGDVLKEEEIIRPYKHLNDYTNENVNETMECLRKNILLWNYLPMVVKAIFNTKKRSLDIIPVSKRFEK